jgi:hypothetical protein
VPSVRADLLPVVLAAGVGFAAVGLYLVAWDLFVTQSTCTTFQPPDGCTGRPLAMTLVGLPVLYVVWAVGLRGTGARHAALAPLALGVALFVLARMVMPYETTLWLWPTATGVLSAAWRWRFSPERSAPPGRRG